MTDTTRETYKYVQELPEPITAIIDHQGHLIVASGKAMYKAKLPDGEILYQMTFALLEETTND